MIKTIFFKIFETLIGKFSDSEKEKIVKALGFVIQKGAEGAAAGVAKQVGGKFDE